jgi:D-alanyl-lipoteichoic acid acyltransferase DltB (MBOAT superfamily)
LHLDYFSLIALAGSSQYLMTSNFPGPTHNHNLEFYWRRIHRLLNTRLYLIIIWNFMRGELDNHSTIENRICFCGNVKAISS